MAFIYGSSDGDENQHGEDEFDFLMRGVNGDCLASCMQTTWFCMASQRKTCSGMFYWVCVRKQLKVKADKSKVMVLNGEEGLECEVSVDGMQL